MPAVVADSPIIERNFGIGGIHDTPAAHNWLTSFHFHTHPAQVTKPVISCPLAYLITGGFNLPVEREMIIRHHGMGLGRVIDVAQTHFPRIYDRLLCPVSALVKDIPSRLIIRNEIDRIIRQEPFPAFKFVQIETINRCNNDCGFCPVNKNHDPRPFKLMDSDLFYSIIEQLKEMNYAGTLELFSNNEPLLDKRIVAFTETARKALPHASIILFTNGILLTPEKFRKLIPNLDKMRIDNYSWDGDLISQVKTLLDDIRDVEEYARSVEIVSIKKSAIRSTRGGIAKNRGIVYFLKSPCTFPFTQLVIRPDGKISLCCNDAYGRYTLGDLTTQTLSEIWNGNKFRAIREEIMNGRHRLPLCNNCDVFQFESAGATKLYHLLRDGSRGNQ